MTHLNLSPLPSLRPDRSLEAAFNETDGFVDDAVVLALLVGPSTERVTPQATDLILPADEMDFAGIGLVATPPTPRAITAQRPAPPAQPESGLDEPHHGQHRWWLAVVAGVACSLLFSALLIFLTARIPGSHGENLVSETFAKPEATTPAKSPPAKTTPPQLTDLTP